MYDKTTFLSGLAMGLIGKGNPTFEGSGKMLYNGVALPNVYSVYTPQLQKSHPYAVMLEHAAVPECRLYLVDQPFIKGFTSYIIPAEANRIVYYATAIRWEYKESGTGDTVYFGNALWANTDISPIPVLDPIPVEDAFTKGYHVGATLRRKRVLPVAYLYNGVRLPKLPDANQYDPDGLGLVYMMIVYDQIDFVGQDNPQYRLFIANKPLEVADGSTLHGTGLVQPNEVPYYWQCGAVDDGCWVNYVNNGLWQTPNYAESSNGLTRLNFKQGDKVVWANHNVLSIGGETVYLAASEPVPVYE